MASYGFNFRASSGYVTDSAGQTYSLGAAYPETRNGITFGWETIGHLDMRDRDSGIDVRLAGMNFNNASGGAHSTFRIDLPSSGSWDVRCAVGDTSGHTDVYFKASDDATAFITVDSAGGHGAYEWFDAGGTVRTSASDWVNNNASVNRSFASTIMRFQIGKDAASGISCVAHIEVSSAGGGGTTRGMPFGTRSTAFNGGRTFAGVLR